MTLEEAYKEVDTKEGRWTRSLCMLGIYCLLMGYVIAKETPTEKKGDIIALFFLAAIGLGVLLVYVKLVIKPNGK